MTILTRLIIFLFRFLWNFSSISVESGNNTACGIQLVVTTKMMLHQTPHFGVYLCERDNKIITWTIKLGWYWTTNLKVILIALEIYKKTIYILLLYNSSSSLLYLLLLTLNKLLSPYFTAQECYDRMRKMQVINILFIGLEILQNSNKVWQA